MMEEKSSLKTSIKRPAAASIWYTAASVLGRGIGLFFTPIFSRVLTMEQYGLYTLYTTWLGLFTIISTLEISGSVFMRALQKSPEDKSTVFWSAVFLELGLCTTICILYFAFFDVLNTVTKIPPMITLAIFFTVAANSIINLYLSLMKFSYKYKTVFCIGILLAIPQPIGALIIIKLMPSYSAYARIVMQVLMCVVIAIFIIIFSIKRRMSFSLGIARAILMSALPMLPHFLAISLVSRLDKLTVSKLFGRGALAAYSVAEMIGSLPIFLLGAVFSALIPWIMRKLSAKKQFEIETISSDICRLLCYGTAILLAFSPEIISILAPTAYRAALFIAYPIAITAIPYFLLTVSVTAITHNGRGWLASISSLAGASIMILSCEILGKISYQALAFTQLLAYTVTAALAYILLIRLSCENIINIKKALFAFALSIILASSLYLSYAYPVLRASVALLCILPMTMDLRAMLRMLKEKQV